MLIAFHAIRRTKLVGPYRTVGTIVDLLIDAQAWIVRHVVVDTGEWLPGRRVLIPPGLLGTRDWQRNEIAVGLTQVQIENSPDVDTQKTVSRQMEIELFKHYDVPTYWGPAGTALTGGPAAVPVSTQVPVDEQRELEEQQTNLRSAGEIKNYYIKATDGDIGHVEELIVDDQEWTIRYVVVDTKNWLPARKVLIAPQWIDSISWADATVDIDLTREQIKESPEYDPLTPINRGYEERLYDFYGRSRYWVPHSTDT